MKLVVDTAGVEDDDGHAKTSLLWALRDVGLHGTTFRFAQFCASAPTRHLREPSAQPCQYEGDRK
jgi:hypothetical protein